VRGVLVALEQRTCVRGVLVALEQRTCVRGVLIALEQHTCVRGVLVALMPRSEKNIMLSTVQMARCGCHTWIHEHFFFFLSFAASN
jgi:small nuclear ribonucleoprotein (snRNP)-like protein